MSEADIVTTREQLVELASVLRCRDGLGAIAGTRGRIVMTAGGITVEPGTTASLSLLLQLLQTGLLDISESFVLARMPTEAEAALLRALLGITQGTI